MSALNKMYHLVTSIMTKDGVEAFLEPVDWKALNLHDYPIIIKQPMDLGTIKARLESGQYQKHHQVADDMRLVWSNCRTYNQEGSYLYKIADKLSKSFEQQYAKIRQEEPGVPEDDSQPPSLEEKRHFRVNLYKITSEDLGEVIKVLEERSPEAIDKVTNKDEIEVNIDMIPGKTFQYLAALIKRRLPEKKAGGTGAKKQKTETGARRK